MQKSDSVYWRPVGCSPVLHLNNIAVKSQFSFLTCDEIPYFVQFLFLLTPQAQCKQCYFPMFSEFHFSKQSTLNARDV
jgi:hypothetical protein